MTSQTNLCLNKFLAQAGVCSRRKADDLIRFNHVKINDVIITVPYTKVSKCDIVKVRDEIVGLEKKIYILLNKPKNTISTVSDINERKTVLDIFKPTIKERLYPVGRLDRDTTGLLLMTNDGDFTQRLAHPKFNVKKVYRVTLSRSVSPRDMHLLLRGVKLEDGFMKADEAYYPTDKKSVVCIAIHSGQNHIVKRLFQELNYHVTHLDRSNYAGLTKRSLPQGEWRYLTNDEVRRLLKQK